MQLIKLARVWCIFDLYSGPCTDRDVRLVGAMYTFEGRVEICVEGIWGTICRHLWDSNDAMVVCRQLNLPTDGTYITYCLAHLSLSVAGKQCNNNVFLQVLWHSQPCLHLEVEVDQFTWTMCNVWELSPAFSTVLIVE